LIVKTAAVHHLVLLKRRNFLTAGREDMHQRAKFRGDRSNHCGDMVIFRFFKTSAAAILDFQNLGILEWEGSRGSKCINLQNCIAIGQTVAEIWQFISLFNMAAVGHLEFVMRVFGPHTKNIWWSQSLCKIWLESVQ